MDQINNNYVLPEYAGWFRPYPFLLFTGFVVACLVTIFRAKRKNIPLVPFEKFIFALLPTALIFASFFGKLDYKHPIPFYELFFFWEAGLSIHGAILGGVVAGLCYFPSQSKKYKISMWVWLDLIAPNILLGQAIGRWGNFFNHEILGQPVSYESLKWLPAFIRDSCFRFDLTAQNPFSPELYNSSLPATYDNIIFRQPLFLYEMFAMLLLWIILIFVIPNIGKWLSYHKIKNIDEFTNLTWKGKWNKAYYELEVDKELSKKYSEDYQHLKISQKLTTKQKLKLKNKDNILYIKHIFKKSSKNLTVLHNPNNIHIVRAGVIGSLFFFGYNFIRIFLEMQRQPQELFIKNLPAVSYTIIILFSLMGIISMVFAQFIAPNKWRLNGWYYEKQY